MCGNAEEAVASGRGEERRGEERRACCRLSSSETPASEPAASSAEPAARAGDKLGGKRNEGHITWWGWHSFRYLVVFANNLARPIGLVYEALSY